jgi:lysyl-tRNA synthetase class 2
MNEHELEHNELIDQRIEKVEELKKLGINPYPIRFFPDSHSKELINNYTLIMNENETLQKMEKEKTPDVDVSKVHIIHKLAGRVQSKRIMGKASFAHLKDRDGIIQLYASEKDLGRHSVSYF